MRTCCLAQPQHILTITVQSDHPVPRLGPASTRPKQRPLSPSGCGGAKPGCIHASSTMVPLTQCPQNDLIRLAVIQKTVMVNALERSLIKSFFTAFLIGIDESSAHIHFKEKCGEMQVFAKLRLGMFVSHSFFNRHRRE